MSDLNIVKTEYPAWFRKDNGFRFLDPNGNLYIVMGPGAMRTFSRFGNLKIDKPHDFDRTIYLCHINKHAVAAVYFSGGEWFLTDLSLSKKTQEWWDNCRPFMEVEASDVPESNIANRS